MRHLLSLLAGVVVAPLTWCLIALGQSGSQDQVGEWVSSRRFDTVDLIEPAIYLAVAGILLGLIATLRISPVGPLVAGLLLVAAYVGMFISPLKMHRAVPDDWEVQNRHFALTVPLDNGTLALIGVLLIMAVFSAERWRRPVAAVVVPGATGASDSAPGISGGPDSASGAATEPDADLAAPDPVGEPVLLPDRSPEPEKVSVGAETSAKSAEASAGTGSAPKSGAGESTSDADAEKAAATRTETPTESPWSAPPGQSRPEKS